MNSFEADRNVTPDELDFIVGACKQMNRLFGGGLEPEINWLTQELASIAAKDLISIEESERYPIPTLTRTGLAVGPIVTIALELDESIHPNPYSDNYNRAGDILDATPPVKSCATATSFEQLSANSSSIYLNAPPAISYANDYNLK